MGNGQKRIVTLRKSGLEPVHGHTTVTDHHVKKTKYAFVVINDIFVFNYKRAITVRKTRQCRGYFFHPPLDFRTNYPSELT